MQTQDYIETLSGTYAGSYEGAFEREPTQDVLLNVKLLDLLVDIKDWSVKAGYLEIKLDIESSNPFYSLTKNGKALDWSTKASLLYHHLIKMPNFALDEHLLKKSVYQENGERRTFRVTGKAIRDYGYLIAEGFTLGNNTGYTGKAWDDDIAAGFTATGKLFNEA
ncbi:MAG: hypothetical protein COB67_00030 [SAR324 cluster bacterium]|uniref:Uncharacterized protein n=1 Tax=SAR324 cluster bacterium TaxID=2024889 RepID=A0A2A4TD33_9DELT|nr:MAG: hypothetical protein COB67_00030 [SAR324 cluster bacterium]